MSEPLHSTNPYPLGRAFVVKLHQDADLMHGVLRGRIEHVASGIRGEFVGTDQLVGWLARGVEHGCDDTLPPQPRNRTNSVF